MDGVADERWLSHDIEDPFLQEGFPRAFYDPDEYQKLTPDVIAEFLEADEYLPQSAKASGYTTLLTVLARGWSRAQVDAILGEPDELSRNPHYRKAALMRLYLKARVLQAEKGVCCAAKEHRTQAGQLIAAASPVPWVSNGY
jgi:hypothetical protein